MLSSFFNTVLLYAKFENLLEKYNIGLVIICNRKTYFFMTIMSTFQTRDYLFCSVFLPRLADLFKYIKLVEVLHFSINLAYYERDRTTCGKKEFTFTSVCSTDSKIISHVLSVLIVRSNVASRTKCFLC